MEENQENEHGSQLNDEEIRQEVINFFDYFEKLVRFIMETLRDMREEDTDGEN